MNIGLNRHGCPLRFALVLLGALALGACDAAEAVDIQPLPPLDRASPEARLGLPEIRGDWRFAGWEVLGMAPDSAAGADAPNLAAPGAFALRTQRLDSVAGVYAFGGAQFPLIGEVRRDSVVSLVTAAPGAEPRFAAGRLLRDTLWIELTSFGVADAWPAGTRAAFVRAAPAAPFLRYAAQIPVAEIPPPITEGTEPSEGMLPRAPVQPETSPVIRPAQPVAPVPSAAPAPLPRPREQAPQIAPRPEPVIPQTPAPARDTAPRPRMPTIPEPELPAPAVPRRATPPVLPGVPVTPAQPDTTPQGGR